MTGYNQAIENFIEKQDEVEFQVGDTLDVKTSIALVVITFLAIQSAELLKGDHSLSSQWHGVQLASVASLVLAGVLAIVELWPRDYKAPMSPDEFLGWVSELEDFYKDDPDPKESALSEIHRKQIEKIKVRFSINRSINVFKSGLIVWMFRFTMASLVLNLATLFRTWIYG